MEVNQQHHGTVPTRHSTTALPHQSAHIHYHNKMECAKLKLECAKSSVIMFGCTNRPFLAQMNSKTSTRELFFDAKSSVN